MTNKKKSDPPKIELKKRVPKEKPNLFQNLTPFPKPNSHPLAELMNLPFREEQEENVSSVNQDTISGLTEKTDLVNRDPENELTKKTDLVNHSDYSRLTENKNTVNRENDFQLTTEEISVNQEMKPGLTTNENSVNMLTKTEAWLTKDEENNEILVNKLTKNKTSVNQKKESGANWKTSERRRTDSLSKVEGFRTSANFIQRVREFCAKHKIDKQDFYRNAGESYMQSLVNQEGADLVNMLTLDDRRLRLLWKTKPALINLYLRYNLILNPNSRWTANDDDAACKFNEYDYRLIELGIIQTQANKKFAGKIASFGYYANEIENFINLNLPAESIGVMLEINRKRWQQATGRELNLEFLEIDSPDS